MLPLITLEEHYLSKVARSNISDDELGLNEFPPKTAANLMDLGAQRIKDMDEGGVTIQVVSHNPAAGFPKLEICQTANNQLHQAAKDAVNRFAGFALLPMNQPQDAVLELRRTVKELGFVGALVSNHAEGRSFDDEFYWPVFECAQELDVPIYIHPTFPTKEQAKRYDGNYTPAAALALSSYIWGWHMDTGLHFFRLFLSGLFDRFPKLKIILGHMGEAVPFMLDRFVWFETLFGDKLGVRKRQIREVWDTNIWVTTSGMFSLPPLACALHSVKMDRILYSVDYPFDSNVRGRGYLEMIEKSGLITQDQLAMIAYQNAEKLLKIKVPA